MTFERNVIRADQVRRLDRETWADLDAVGYEFVVTGEGEAIAGPFYFGRAFDAPPIFSFSAVLKGGSTNVAPQITIGVAEWLIDEQDMYIGANLWIVFSENCFEPPVIGQVNRDPGVEKQLATWGGGPTGNGIPVFESYNGLWFDDLRWYDGSAGPADTYYASHECDEFNPGSGECGTTIFPWEIATDDPHGGSRYLRSIVQVGGGWLASFLFFTNFKKCGHVNRPEWDPYWITAAVNPGQEVGINFWAKRGSGGSVTIGVSTHLWFLDENAHFRGGSFNTSFDGVLNLGPFGFTTDPIPDSWTQYIGTKTVPEGTSFILAGLSPISGSGTAGHQRYLCVDDIDLTITGEGVDYRQPEFDVRCKFGGRALKGYAGVHPLRSYEAPTKVVLS